MDILFLLLVGVLLLGVGLILGYYARQTIAQKQVGTLESEIQRKTSKARQKSEELIKEAKKKADRILEKAKKEIDERNKRLLKTEEFLRDKEKGLEHKISLLDAEKNDFKRKIEKFKRKVEKLKKVKSSIEALHTQALENLERISGLSKKSAKKELLDTIEIDFEKDLLEKFRKLEKQGQEKINERAKEILSLAVQKYASSQVQEITTSTVSLPNEEIKGRIIGKEGRNIKTLERLTGVEIVIDDTSETVIVSAFNPIRRQIAKIALENLIKDGRIQPARIEDMVFKSETEINSQIQKAGEAAVYDTSVIGLDSKIVQLLGRLRFRTSYGQNVLLHSIEVAHLAAALADEIGANAEVAKKAGLLHDIGKSVDHQIQGSHVDIGIKILEKFKIERSVIDAMKSHHEEYPYEGIESVLVQTADAISGARPGARKDSLENYLQRLEDLEKIALSFKGVEKAWALYAGREIRVFVNPKVINDWEAHKLAKEIVVKIQEELKYPGEIKVNVIRESRVVEYAR